MACDVTAEGDLKLPVCELTLANGLTLLFLEDHTAPVFTLMLWVPAGGRTEAPGKSGVSHYLEHCYSLGSARLGPREVDRIVQSLGGQKNAFTSADATAYTASLPSGALARIIEVEADRLAALALPEDALRSELEVIREERRLRYENAPGGVIQERILALGFERHPYRNPVIGWPDDLARLCRADVAEYYRRHYAPANATYVLVGDFDAGEAEALFRRHMGEIPPGARPDVAVETEPEQTSERRAIARMASVKLPRVAMLWKVPPLDHPESAALEVLETALLEGEAARLDRVLRRERRLVSTVGGGHWGLRDAGPFTLEAEALAGVAPEDVEGAVDEVLRSVREDGVGPVELGRAKKMLALGTLRGLESTSARARAIGRYHVTSARGWRHLQDELRMIEAVSNEDVRRAAARYLVPGRRSVVTLLPATNGTAVHAAAAPAVVEPRHRAAVEEMMESRERRAESRGLPAPGSQLPVSWSCVQAGSKLGSAAEAFEPWGQARRWILPSGLTVYCQRVDRLPLVSIAASVRAGAARDPSGKAGLATMTLELLRCGTAVRDEEALAAELADLGATLGTGCGADAVSLSTNLLARDLEQGVALLAEVLRRPAFDRSKQARVRGELLAEKASAASRAEELLVEAFYEAAFRGGPYELPVNGTPEMLGAIERDDVADFHARWYRPGETALAVVGAVDPERVGRAVAQAFGDWASVPVSVPEPVPPPPSTPLRRSPQRVFIVDKPDQTQVHVRIGLPALSRSAPDYDALSFANAVLGASSLAARIADVVRTRNGLAYSASTMLVPRLLPGPFAAAVQTRTAGAARALELIIAELSRVAREPIPKDELERTRSWLVGSLPYRLETNAQKAFSLLEGFLFDLGPDHLAAHIDRIRALSAEDVLAAARRHIRTDDMLVVAVGDAAALRPALARFERAEAPS